MRLDPEQARAALPRVDPGRVRSGRPVGLRDGALLALVAAGLSAVEIAGLKASEVSMAGGRLVVELRRDGAGRCIFLPIELGARLLAWLTECRLWALPEPVFRGPHGALTSDAVRKVLDLYTTAPRRRRSA